MGFRATAQLSAIVTGSGTAISGLGTMGGTMYYHNNPLGGGAQGSAIVDILHNLDPASLPWYVYQSITATSGISGAIDISRFGGYWNSQNRLVYSGNGTGRITTVFDFP